MGLLLITRFTLQEALRRKLLLAMLILSLLLLCLFTFTLSKSLEGLQANNPDITNTPQFIGIVLTIPAMWIAYLLSSILTILFTVGMISGEIEAGTFVLIVPKPLRRSEIVLGKWLGHALIVCIYTMLLFGAFAGAIYWQTGYLPEQWPNALGLLLLGMLTLLGITTLGSTLFPTVVNGAIALVLFLAAPIMSIAQAIQIATPSITMQNIATSVDLLLPVNALWHTTAFYLLPDTAFYIMQDLPLRGYTNIPFMAPTPISPAMLIWGLLYSIVLPGIAVLSFRKRDL